MAIRRSSHRAVRAYRRPTFWGRSPADAAITFLAGATAVIDSSSVPVAEGQTIIRIRGQILVTSDQQAASENWVGAVGACVVSDQAVVGGLGAIPTPYTDQDSDLWLMHQYFGGVFDFATAASFNSLGSLTFAFDSKAMRKQSAGETLIFVVENGGAAAIGIKYWLQFATLFKVR